MTITLFILLTTICSMVSGLLTECFKVFYNNAGKTYSANLIAFFNALIIGCGGTAAAYILLGIVFSLSNIICLLLMTFVIWVGSMIGYDKIMQLIIQIKDLKWL